MAQAGPGAGRPADALRLGSRALSQSVLIVGGGLAGLAAAQALARHGLRVTVLEARQRLGGRASSFTDAATGQLIDACQHVSMGCCTNFARFCESVGIAHLIQPQRTLYFMTPDRRVSRFRADDWPAPLHLARSFLSAHYLSATEKLRIAWALSRLKAEGPDDPPFLDWLQRHGQSQRCIDCFWGLVLTSALNETPDRIGLRYARKVFVDGFLGHPRGFEVQLPTVPLGRLYGAELLDWFDAHGVVLRLNTAARSVVLRDGRIAGLETRAGETLTADWYIVAVPFDRVLQLLPDSLIDSAPYFANLHQLETSPITSVHLWYDRPITRLPHVVLVDCLGQWLFQRGESQPGEHYVQVVVSAARPLRG
ncbi:MAG: FAD-dependent oxidoreductase, partial [Planctomycetia bacterium]|nr:FAD-dependent oxidoreductase [Planctomycetia bacterium]